MFHPFHSSTGLYAAQAYLPPVYSPSVWTQILTVLVVGLITAFAFQLLLTILGAAIAISSWKVLSVEQPAKGDAATDNEQHQTNLNAIAGLGILLTVNSVLFGSSFLATKFSQMNSPALGAIAGIVVWAAYLLLLLWLSSVAVSSIVGSFLNLTTAGLRQIISTIVAAFSNTENSNNENGVITEAEIVETLQQEVRSTLETIDLQTIVEEQIKSQYQTILPQISSGSESNSTKDSEPNGYPAVVNFWKQVEAYLTTADSRSLTPKRLDRKLQKLIQSTQAQLTQAQLLDAIITPFDSSALAALLDQRQDLTDKKKHRILAQIETIWENIENNLNTESLHIESLNTKLLNTESESISKSMGKPVESKEALLDPKAILSKAALDAVKGQVMDQISAQAPKMLQQVKTTLPDLPSLTPATLEQAQTIAHDSMQALHSLLPDALKHEAEQEQSVAETESGLTELGQSLTATARDWRDRATQQIESIQQSAQEQVEALKHQTEQRVEATRKAAATAAWWLFATLLTGAISASFAGAIASGLNPLQQFTLLLHWLNLSLVS